MCPFGGSRNYHRDVERVVRGSHPARPPAKRLTLGFLTTLSRVKELETPVGCSSFVLLVRASDTDVAGAPSTRARAAGPKTAGGGRPREEPAALVGLLKQPVVRRAPARSPRRKGARRCQAACAWRIPPAAPSRNASHRKRDLAYRTVDVINVDNAARSGRVSGKSKPCRKVSASITCQAFPVTSAGSFRRQIRKHKCARASRGWWADLMKPRDRQCAGVTRTKLVAVAQRVLSNTLLTTFFASKCSSANWRANRHWRS
jgi:hypothetical protein